MVVQWRTNIEGMQHGGNCYEKCRIGVLTAWTSPESGFDSTHNDDNSRRKDEPPAETIYVRGRVLSCGINRAILHKPFWDEFRGLRIDLRIIEDRPTTQDSACTLVRVMVWKSGTHQTLIITMLPLGMKYPLYSSSSVLTCANPMGPTGCHLSVSFTIASMYGSRARSANSGSRSELTTASSCAWAFFCTSG